jgi:hypothetical protein
MGVLDAQHYEGSSAFFRRAFTLCANFHRIRRRGLLGAARRSAFQTDQVVVPRLTAE